MALRKSENQPCLSNDRVPINRCLRGAYLHHAFPVVVPRCRGERPPATVWQPSGLLPNDTLVGDTLVKNVRTQATGRRRDTLTEAPPRWSP